ncbi:hypothetical protein [Streptococcus thoraltensis]|uniref:hypothetical protein n=1 Tax=Streptococcus thoraltensis TaxID=55085 RepID=UPI0003AAA2A4|nr:hypothetical protein [Streptococcus thoraltensis]
MDFDPAQVDERCPNWTFSSTFFFIVKNKKLPEILEKQLKIKYHPSPCHISND